jgi:hypothetical protein
MLVQIFSIKLTTSFKYPNVSQLHSKQNSLKILTTFEIELGYNVVFLA